MDSIELEYIFQHVFLPPQLPQTDDSSHEGDLAVANSVLSALRSYNDLVDGLPSLVSCIAMLERMLETRDPSGSLLCDEIESQLAATQQDSIAFHLRAQNAGLVIRRHDESFVFEIFQISSSNNDTNATKGRLRRRFPDAAVALNSKIVRDPNFQDPFANMLSKLDTSTPFDAQKFSQKAGQKVQEIRDVVSPRFVTEMMMGILHGLGDPVEVHQISKRTREEVLWSDTYRPWRRSPFWLFLRCVLQMTMMRDAESDHGYYLFKSSMAFHMSSILERALDLDVGSEMLFCMRAKIVTRLMKIDGAVELCWLPRIREVVSRTTKELQRRWHDIEGSSDLSRTLTASSALTLTSSEDTKLNLVSLKQYLRKIESRSVKSSVNQAGSITVTSRVAQTSSILPNINQSLTHESALLLLADTEMWTRDCLTEWHMNNSKRLGACFDLAGLIADYTTAARSSYKGNPEGISIMLLTTMELWISLDKIATHHCPILLDYATTIPTDLFEPLILPKKADMQRLIAIETYLLHRKNMSKPDLPSVFQSSDSEKCLGSRFYARSPDHQKLRQEIERYAAEERKEKIAELENLKVQQKDLVSRANAMICETVSKQVWDKATKTSTTTQTHSPSCKKCKLEQQARTLSISPHEWPLPARELEIQRTIFELDVPEPIGIWRDATYALLVDILSPPSPSGQPAYQKSTWYLYGYGGLRKYIGRRSSRLQLCSTVKPFSVTHYNRSKVSTASKSSVCVPNGMQFEMFDTSSYCQARKQLGHCGIRDTCTWKMPSGSFHCLQYAVTNTTHDPNLVLSQQSFCPPDITIQEFLSFGLLRSGHRLQWQNIACFIQDGSLDINREEAEMLILQAAWQAGPAVGVISEEVLRDSHHPLSMPPFCSDLIKTLTQKFSSIKKNWQGITAARILAALSLRILSLSDDSAVHLESFQLLDAIRDVLLQWTDELSLKLLDCKNEQQRKEWSICALNAALSCHSTFYIDNDRTSEFVKSTKILSKFTKCSIIIRDLCPAAADSLPALTKRLLFRFFRLSHLLEGCLRQAIVENSQGLDDSIGRLWSSYLPGTGWKAHVGPNSTWVESFTTGNSDTRSLSVHYNLLDGTLLVDGSPLSRLPKSFEEHVSYRRLLGSKVLKVLPSPMQGMRYVTRDLVQGYQLHFAFHERELIIRAEKKYHATYEIIPATTLHGIIQPMFADDYSHWLDLGMGNIEFRSLSDPWTSPGESNSCWILSKETRLARGSQNLVDISSPTMQSIARVLGAIETPLHVHVMFNSENRRLEIHLPRFKLNFFVNSELQLESKQHRHMIIDVDQSCATFTGLRDKLILCSLKDRSRSIIVPHGGLHCARFGNHVELKIDTGLRKDIPYYYYELDTTLHRVIDNGSLKARLLRCLIHAMTSHCLPDSFTGLTGTEQAMDVLREASTRSFQSLTEDDMTLLKEIAKLTPHRAYYPRHLTAMQQVRWRDDVTQLAQHESFVQLVGEIIEVAQKNQVFHPTKVILNAEDRGHPDLLQRAIIRNATFRTPGYGAESHKTELDSICSTKLRCGSAENRVRCITGLVRDWSKDLDVERKILTVVESWGAVIHRNLALPASSFGYHEEWLNSAEQILPKYWCRLQTLLSRLDPVSDKYRLAMLLATLAYSGRTNQRLIETLLAFATLPDLRQLQMPVYDRFNLSEGYQPKQQVLTSLIISHKKSFEVSPESKLPALGSETFAQADFRRRNLYSDKQDDLVPEIAKVLLSGWPSEIAQVPNDKKFEMYFKTACIASSVNPKFAGWFHNKAFKEFVQRIQSVLDGKNAWKRATVSYKDPELVVMPKPQSRCAHVDWDLLLSKVPPDVLTCEGIKITNLLTTTIRTETYGQVEVLLTDLLSRATDQYERLYCREMLESLESLQHANDEGYSISPCSDFKGILTTDLVLHEKTREETHSKIVTALIDTASSIETLAYEVGLWPRLTPLSFLRLLRNEDQTVGPSWKHAFIQYGLTITTVQRSKRLLGSMNDEAELLKEILNSGHKGWEVETRPEWLLFEIENNILIRSAQAHIAHEMLSPSSGHQNTVMQLNMGEGKSSVIVPIVAAALADGQHLARVICLPALAVQMYDIMRQKLGGLLNRRVVRAPFSRSMQLNRSQVESMAALYQEFQDEKCVVLCQPEHVLSYELMGIEKSLPGSDELDVGSRMVECQQWLDQHTRDILDESDEILSVQFELIYTIGLQRSIDFSPSRWTVLMQVLDTLSRCVLESGVLHEFPHGFQITHCASGGFPRIQIIEDMAGSRLIEMVAKQTLAKGLPGLPVWQLSTEDRDGLFHYITDCELTETDLGSTYASIFSVEQTRLALLLLKGLFAYGVLLFVFQRKRWRVNYGLDLSRSMLAVPYRAKDQPALRSEFSHPDATIALTCITYYYGGLTDNQLFLAFERLQTCDDASGEYQRWTLEIEGMPESLRTLGGVNLRDIPQCIEHLFPRLRYCKEVIDFYLSHLVFPKEMKEFPQKLSSSGWDIAKDKGHTTTGFSGTNDSRYLLPLSIKQADLPQVSHTNAAVLSHLLHCRNSYQTLPDANGLDTNAILELVVQGDPAIRVILDVGALVLDLRNDEVARAWLERVSPSDAQAVVYVDDHDELVVLDRYLKVEKLRESHFLKQLDQCLIYLDEAHTRGTDLKLPIHYRAAVTLALDLTKDRLVQACMRMRKLARGQSVVLCASAKVQLKILQSIGKNEFGNLDVSDILLWSMQNTQSHTRKNVPLWAVQGMRYQNRSAHWHDTRGTASRSITSTADLLLDPEAKTLVEWYGPREVVSPGDWDVPTGRENEVNTIRETMRDFGVKGVGSAKLQEEQERELQPEAEQQRQVQRPPSQKPAQHNLDKLLLGMVQAGQLNRSSAALVPAFKTMEKTTAASRFNLKSWPVHLLTTHDFARTIQSNSKEQDEFVRPVQWILSCYNSGLSIIISPFEANLLLPHIRKRESRRIALQIYSPRIASNMTPMDDLNYCTIPSTKDWKWAPDRQFTLSLNLFAGQLYFQEYDDYVALCNYLGLCWKPPKERILTNVDGFVDPADRAKYNKVMQAVCSLNESPVPMLKKLTGFRRKGQGYAKSHMGMLLGGELIERKVIEAANH